MLVVLANPVTRRPVARSMAALKLARIACWYRVLTWTTVSCLPLSIRNFSLGRSWIETTSLWAGLVSTHRPPVRCGWPSDRSRGRHLSPIASPSVLAVGLSMLEANDGAVEIFGHEVHSDLDPDNENSPSLE